MKTIIFLAVIAFAAAEPDLYYFFENSDLKSILNNDEQFEDFVVCILEKGPCEEVYKSYKDLLTAAVKGKCQNCTPYQRHLFWVFLQKVLTKSPENYILFRAKYDPENIYLNDLIEELQYKAI